MTIQNQLKVILERSSMTYMKKHLDKYTERVTSNTKKWRSWVRQQLSVLYVKGTKNTSLYPKLRSGDLRKSLIESRIQVKKLTKLQGGRAKAEIIIPVAYHKLKNDYGEKLNSSSRFANSSFFKWKERVQDELIRRTKGRV